MQVGKSSGGCPLVTEVHVRWRERPSRDLSEDASFTSPPLNSEIVSLVARLLRHRSLAA